MERALEIRREHVAAEGIRFSALAGERELGHVFSYYLRNDLHEEPFAYGEDLSVTDEGRATGAWVPLLTSCLADARARGCYKLVATSRHGRSAIHRLYTTIGAQSHGLVFRFDLVPAAGDRER